MLQRPRMETQVCLKLLHVLVSLSILVDSTAVGSSTMCQPVLDLCDSRDREGVTLEAWAQRLFLAVSKDDISCMGSLCLQTWLQGTGFTGDCCQAVGALDNVMQATTADRLGISENLKMYVETLMVVYSPISGTVYRTAEWWRTEALSSIASVPTTPNLIFWRPGEPITYPFWNFARVALGDKAYGLVRHEVESNWPSMTSWFENTYSNDPEAAVNRLKHILVMLSRLDTVEWTTKGREYPTNLLGVTLSERTPVKLVQILDIELTCFHAQVCRQWSGNMCQQTHPTLTLTWCL